MSRKKILRLLHRAMSDRVVVRVERTPRFADRIDGVVVSIGTRWVLMTRTVDGGYPDGLIALRLRDIRSVNEDGSIATEFFRMSSDRSASSAGELDLDGVAGVLRSLGASGRLIGIEKERERSALWIGTLDEIHGRFVYVHELTPAGSWRDHPLGYRLRAITAIETGTRYQNALATVANAE